MRNDTGRTGAKGTAYVQQMYYGDLSKDGEKLCKEVTEGRYRGEKMALKVGNERKVT